MKYILPIFSALLLIAFAVCADAPDADVARIHVIANSDSEEDVALKMKVAEGITQLLCDGSFDSLESVGTGLEERLDEIVSVSNGILDQWGADYGSRAEVGVRYFDRQSLGTDAFPEGEYLALTVTLGEGKGHNWWSVIFPDVSLEASLALGEDGRFGKTVVSGSGAVVKIRCLIFDLCNFILTKR